MPFTTKDWQDSPSTATPISAAALEDLETRVSGWADTRAAFVNVKTDFGAVGDGSTNDTAAIQAAIDSLPAAGNFRGGVVFFPKGRYNCTGQLVVRETKSIRFLGAGGVNNITDAGMASALRFTGTGSGSFIDARSSHGFQLENLGIDYTSGSYTGSLIDFQHSIGFDSAFALIKDCAIAGNNVVSAKCLVDFKEAILCRVEGGYMAGAQAGIRFRHDNGAGNVSYSNAHRVSGVTFVHFTTGALMNAGQTLKVEDCWFEGTQVNSGDALVKAYADDITSAPTVCYGVSFSGCWMGDAVAVTNWVDFGAASVQGFELVGSFLSGGTKGVKFGGPGGGYQISGNLFGSMTNAVDLGTTGTPNCYGALITGNSMDTSGAPVLNTAGQFGVTVLNNTRRQGDNRGEDLLSLTGHITTDQNRGSALTATVQAAAGSGATASLAAGSNDTCGTLTINMGTGTTAGNLCNVTFPFAWDSAPSSQTPSGRAKVFFQPRNDVASALDVSSQGGNNTGISVYARTAPTVSTTYIWDYFCLQ